MERVNAKYGDNYIYLPVVGEKMFFHKESKTKLQTTFEIIMVCEKVCDYCL